MGLIFHPIFCISMTANTWIAVALALDRFYALCRPERARTHCTWKNALRITFLVFVTAILYNVPRYFEVQVRFTVSLSF